MKKRFTLSSFLFVVVLAGFSGRAMAQADTETDNHQITVEVPEVALLDLETSSSLNFTASFTKPANDEAGNKIVAPDANNTIWLNYTSIQDGTTTKKVNVTADVLVPGVDIHVVAAAAAGGAGTKGTPSAGFNLTTGSQTLISGIGSAYTGSGSTSGHELTYTFVAADGNYANLRSGNTTVTVTYTLADN